MSKEEQLFPGVYITDMRQKPSLSEGESDMDVAYRPPPGFEGNPELLEIEIGRLQNSIGKLQESNQFMTDAMLEAKEVDVDFLEAIDENKAVIAKQEYQIQVLKRSLEACGCSRGR
jgi:hypothetical protein